MGSAKAWLAIAIILGLLWWLHPTRQLRNHDDAKVVEIVYVGPGGPLAGAIADVIREFEVRSERAHEQDPSQPIYRVISGQNASRNQTDDPTRFLVSVAGKSPPDVIQFDRYAVAEWAARGGFEPLNDYINRDLAAGIDTPQRDKFYKSAWDESMYGGKLYGVPISIDSRALLYNKDSFRRAGLVDSQGEPTAPRTWEDLRLFARKLTVIEHRTTGEQVTLDRYFASLPPNTPLRVDSSSYKLVQVGFLPMFGNSWLYIYGWMNRGEFMSGDGRSVTLNDPRIVDALTWVREIYDELGGFDQAKAFESGFQSNALDPLITGKLAMKIDGFYVINVLGRYARDIDFGTAPPPLPQASIDAGLEKLSWSGGWAYAIPATAKHKQAGWELIRFLVAKESIAMQLAAEKQFAQAEGRFFFPEQSPQIAINEWQYQEHFGDASLSEKYKNSIRVFNDLLPHCRFRPITPIGQQLWNYHVTATELALGGSKSPQLALDDATVDLQRQLDRFQNPSQGWTITRWSWFYVLYAVLILLFVVMAYQWDTRLIWRTRIARLLRLSPKVGNDLIDGAGGTGLARTQWMGGIIAASPWLLGFIIFGGGPMLFSLVISFCRWDILSEPVFVGASNYRILLDDELVWKSLGNTFFMMLSVPLGMALSLAIALLLNQGVRCLGIWRTVFYLPSIVPLVATSLLFIWIFNSQGGLLSKLIDVVGQGSIQAPNWLQDADWAKPSLILMGLWGAGGGMILWLAGLKSIPPSLYEAASVDGASTLQQFFSITIPQLTPYIFFNLIMGVIGTLQVFGQAFIITQGGPQNSTLFYVYHLFNNAFRYGQMGYASAMAWLLFAIALVLTVLQMWMSKRWVQYDTN